MQTCEASSVDRRRDRNNRDEAEGRRDRKSSSAAVGWLSLALPVKERVRHYDCAEL